MQQAHRLKLIINGHTRLNKVLAIIQKFYAQEADEGTLADIIQLFDHRSCFSWGKDSNLLLKKDGSGMKIISW
jgi:lipoate-protein ligase B